MSINFLPQHQPPMSYYLVVKHDYVTTKETSVVKETNNVLFSDKRNALQQIETIAYQAVISVNGIEHAAKCMYDEKRLIRKQHQAVIEKKYFITQNLLESPDQLTVWSKHDVTKSKPGRIYGQSTWTETILEKQFSVSVIRVPVDVWGTKIEGPTVNYTAKWLENAKLVIPKGATEDEYFAKEHRELSKDYADFLKSTAVFEVLAKRLTHEEVPAINLPKIRFENPDEFLKCPLASAYVPPPIPAAPPAPVASVVTQAVASIIETTN